MAWHAAGALILRHAIAYGQRRFRGSTGAHARRHGSVHGNLAGRAEPPVFEGARWSDGQEEARARWPPAGTRLGAICCAGCASRRGARGLRMEAGLPSLFGGGSRVAVIGVVGGVEAVACLAPSTPRRVGLRGARCGGRRGGVAGRAMAAGLVGQGVAGRVARCEVRGARCVGVSVTGGCQCDGRVDQRAPRSGGRAIPLLSVVT
ncbi:hypothetical protein DAEQUDRAFT_153085 [Daedalea quercina L-15889]|uniref:Uncharacterized protein n=1 Tax=Daedalea quercina L-15889 TaxID=1314783 RepID=A0A165RLU9_9APHY|nr:hypothetical protein DAEQUDRAFT_153085 [Daedalea quercina L-15889]